MQASHPKPTVGHRIATHLRRTFLAGALITVPVVVTYWVMRFLFNLVDGVLRPPFEQALGRRIPGLGAVALVLLIYLLGLLGANFLGRRAIHTGQRALLRIPVVSSIYGAIKSLVESLFGVSGSGATSRRVVLVEYPGPDLWTIGFLTGTTHDEKGAAFALVYVPTAPTPQTGWVAIIPAEKVWETDMTVQEAMRLVLSGGVLGPAVMRRRPLSLDGLGIGVIAKEPRRA